MEQVPGFLTTQIADAKATAVAHRYNTILEQNVQKPHSPLAEEVLRFFASLL